MLLSQFSYDLPQELIAQTPVEPRDASRLLRVDRKTGLLSHHHFFDLPSLLKPGDLLVLNNTKVLPVRLKGKKNTGGEIEVLLTKRMEQNANHEIWQALTKPGLKVGQVVVVGDEPDRLELECVADEGYTRLVRTSAGRIELLRLLDQLGTLPTPPYIREFVGDPARYQTVFAHEPGSAAAPTAGLHFTVELFERLKKAGVQTTEVTLHVGLGTFLPVKENEIEKHHMHSEWYEISEQAAEKINNAKKRKQRIIAVGTTSSRTLESVADKNGFVHAGSGETTLFVYPPYQFRCADGMLTNFHLPESTLLMLVSAFASWPQNEEKFVDFRTSLIGRAYAEAIREQYRFFSFGDVMLIE